MKIGNSFDGSVNVFKVECVVLCKVEILVVIDNVC